MYEALKLKDEKGVAAVFQAQLNSAFSSIDILRVKRPDLLTGENNVGVAEIR